MTTVTTSTNGQLLKAHWRDTFLTEYQSNLVLKSLGVLSNVPEGTGMTTSWFQMSNLATGGVVNQSSDPASTYVSSTLVSATLSQVSQNVDISDVMIRQAAPDFMDNIMKRMGRAAAETEDSLILASIFTAGGMQRFGGTAAFRNSIADASSFDMSIDTVRRASRTLELANAIAHPMAKNGTKYVGVVGPAAKYDLMGDSKWIDIAVNTTTNVGRVDTSTIGSLYNVTFIESTHVGANAGLVNSGSANTDVVQTFILGGEYYGVAQAVGTEIITNIPSPLSRAGLFGSVAYKYLTAYKELHASGMVRLETSASNESRS